MLKAVILPPLVLYTALKKAPYIRRERGSKRLQGAGVKANENSFVYIKQDLMDDLFSRELFLSEKCHSDCLVLLYCAKAA